MADFCSLCYYIDINYDELISKNLDSVKERIDKDGHCFVSDGVCEGCSSHSIKINKDLTVEINGEHYIGNLNPDTYKIEVDESSQIFKDVYKEKKETYLSETKTMNREHDAIKHIAYAIYMVGKEAFIVAQHDCIPFDEFNLRDHGEINSMALDVYLYINKLKEQQ